MSIIMPIIKIITENNSVSDQNMQSGSNSATNTPPSNNISDSFALFQLLTALQERVTRLEEDIKYMAESVKPVVEHKERLVKMETKILHLEESIKEIKEDKRFNTSKTLSIIAIIISLIFGGIGAIPKLVELTKATTPTQSLPDTRQ